MVIFFFFLVFPWGKCLLQKCHFPKMSFIKCFHLPMDRQNENTYTHTFILIYNFLYGLPQWLSSKESACKAVAMGDTGRIAGSGRYPRERHGNPLQYSCLENPMVRGARWAIVHRITKRWTRPSDWVCTQTFTGSTSGKESAHQWSQWKRHSFDPLLRMIFWRRK